MDLYSKIVNDLLNRLKLKHINMFISYTINVLEIKNIIKCSDLRGLESMSWLNMGQLSQLYKNMKASKSFHIKDLLHNSISRISSKAMNMNTLYSNSYNRILINHGWF